MTDTNFGVFPSGMDGYLYLIYVMPSLFVSRAEFDRVSGSGEGFSRANGITHEYSLITETAEKKVEGEPGICPSVKRYPPGGT